MDSNDSLQYSILASGSRGNATYLETAGHRILIDAGLSGKQLEQRMATIDRSLKDVEAIFVTHEHSDHIHGVGVLARRYGMTIYANAGTWEAMADKIGKVPLAQKEVLAPGAVKDFGDLQVESFAVSHDAAEPQFYQVHHDQQAFCILTDTGYVSDRVAGTIKNADAYVMECNHDPEMLMAGQRYSWPLKQRILGTEGHLSNEDGATALMDVIGRRTKAVFLGHRSHENNTKAMAHLTVASLLEAKDFGVDHDFALKDTDQDAASPLFSL